MPPTRHPLQLYQSAATEKAATMYEVPDRKKSINQNKFEFKADGKEFWIPKATTLSLADLDKFETAEGLESAKVLLDLAPTDRVRAVLHTMPVPDLMDLLNAWMSDAGFSLGESKGSEDSSESTDEPSSTTSSASASD